MLLPRKSVELVLFVDATVDDIRHPDSGRRRRQQLGLLRRKLFSSLQQLLQRRLRHMMLHLQLFDQFRLLSLDRHELTR